MRKFLATSMLSLSSLSHGLGQGGCELEYPKAPVIATFCGPKGAGGYGGMATVVFTDARFDRSDTFAGRADFSFEVFVDPRGTDDDPVYSFTDDVPTRGHIIVGHLTRETDYFLKAKGCQETIPFTTSCACLTDDDCDPDEACSPTKNYCEDPGVSDLAPAASGDPHMTGFRGQKFDFTGHDGEWYNLVADDSSSTYINMRVTSAVPSLPEITYITGLSIMATDATGIDHSIAITVKNPHSMESSCPPDSSCLADGSLSVVLDGQEVLSAPDSAQLARDVSVSAVNLPGACRSFGFEKYWEAKQLEAARHGRRRLSSVQSMADWVLGDPTATNMDECVDYVARIDMESSMFVLQSEHASFQIVTPTATIRLSHGRLHQLPMRDPTDRFDIPDHLTWQMNMGVEHNDLSRAARGILGETFVPTRDADGKSIMHGMEAIRGSQEDYRVSGPYGIDFVQNAYTS